MEDQQAETLSVEITFEGDRTAVVRVAGEIDCATSDRVTQASDEAVRDGATRLIFDMSAVTFMDSSGIAALIATRSLADVTLRKPSPAVARLIETTGLTDTFVVEP
jgi:anti-sigma B factor antagonist